ncbi:MDR family MFS transporter [Clostridium estertheticum]|uniref:MDR family MFS transporter n=1 Tax=Clostridium estertheticum TaxID=238834 RepID=UPI001C0C8213|nr:MDR family MFS transporter [Clostridium estertheticum]MBU3187779.1 MFS transporter [Clostridium estertheticum]
MNLNISKRKIYLVMIGLMLAMLMSSLDSTIVGTAMKNITDDLNGINNYTLPIAAYLLCATVATPIFGKLSDIFGRKKIYLIGIVIFMIGSIICGMSQNMIELIIIRGIQGIGGGIIISSTYSLVGEIFNARERGKYMGMIASTYGISSVLGPSLGGIITDYFGWRWIFYLNVPIGLISILLIFKYLPDIKHGCKSKVDYWGIITLIIMLTPLLIVLNLGGTSYEWFSFPVITMLLTSIVFLVIFIIVEKNQEQPIVPLSLFNNSIFLVSVLLSFLSSIIMFGIIIFIPLYMQGVLGTTATNSGVIIMPMTLSMVISSILSGRIISKTGKYKLQGILGFILILCGVVILNFININTSKVYIVISMLITGLGLGSTFPIFNIAVQNEFSNRQIGVVTSGIQFFKNLGSSIGTAVFGLIFSISLKNNLSNFNWNGISDNIKNQINNTQTISNPHMLNQVIGSMRSNQTNLINQILDKIKVTFSSSIHSVFFLLLILAIVSLIMVLFLKEKQLRERTLN